MKLIQVFKELWNVYERNEIVKIKACLSLYTCVEILGPNT